MKKSGFTLIELIAAITIIAIIALITAPNILKTYKQSRIDAMVIQENKLVESGDILVEDYCKNPISDAKLAQSDTYYQELTEQPNEEIITKYICIDDLKKLGYYSEKLKYSGKDCQGVVIFEENKETGLEINSYSYVKCGEKYKSEIDKEINETLFEDCFDETTIDTPKEENKEYTLTVKFTESSLNGPQIKQEYINKKVKSGTQLDTFKIYIPSYEANGNVYEYFIHNKDALNVETKKINGQDVLSGKMPSSDLTINIVYSISKFKLIVNYLYFNPNAVATEKVLDTEETIAFTNEIVKVNKKLKEDYKIFYNGSEDVPEYEIIKTSDTVINLIYQKQTFNITYNNNAGSGCTTGKTTYNKTFGTLCTPTREGYIFDGWYLDGTKITSATQNTYYKDITIKANWTPITYYIEYQANGALGTMQKTECTYDQNCTLRANTFEKTGHSFSNWLDNNANITYTNKQTVKNLTSINLNTVYLVPQWSVDEYTLTLDQSNATTKGTQSVKVKYNRSLPTPITIPQRKYTVTFNYNGNGTSNTTSTSTYTFNGYTYNTIKYYESDGTSNQVWSNPFATTLSINWIIADTNKVTLPTPTRPGYSFSGWYTASSGGTKVGSGGTKYEPTANITLYAIWSKCAVGTYSTGGSSSCTSCPSGYTSAAGATAQNQCYINVSAGKYIASANTSTQTSCAAGTYKASHTVYYGGSSSCSTCSAGTYSTGGSSSCTSCPSGYTSAAGATAQNKCYINVSEGKYIASSGSSTQTSCAAGKYKATHTVYYGSISSCSICAEGTYSTGGSSSCTSCPTNYTSSAAGSDAATDCYLTTTAGKYVATSKGAQVSCTANYYCAGGTKVYYGSTGGSAVCATGYHSSSGASSCTANTCTVVYNCNGGSGSTASSFHTYGIAKNLTANGCSKTGYSFVNWIDSNGKTYTNKQSVNNICTTNNATIGLTAQWNVCTYKIAFNANGGNGTMSNMTLRYTDEKQLTKNDFTRTGYEFINWSGSDGKTYSDQASVTQLTPTCGGTVTMTANWKIKVDQALLLADNSLHFINAPLYTAGQSYNGKTISKVYTDFTNSEYTSATIPWADVRENVTSVNFVDTIIPLSTKYWFDQFKNCSSFDISKLDTSKVTSMVAMFRNAGYNITSTLNITGVEILNTSNVTNMNSMFEGTAYNTGLTLDLSSWNTSNVISMSQMFRNTGSCHYTSNQKTCTTELYLTGWDTSKVTDMSWQFADFGHYSNIVTIKGIDNWKTSNVTNMCRTFGWTATHASSFSVDLSTWNTSKVTNMFRMFTYIGEQTTGDIYLGNLSSWDTSKVTTMSAMFEHAGMNSKSITIGTINNWNVGKVTCSNAFKNNSKISTSLFDTPITTSCIKNWTGTSGDHPSCPQQTY